MDNEGTGSTKLLEILTLFDSFLHPSGISVTRTNSRKENPAPDVNRSTDTPMFALRSNAVKSFIDHKFW